DRRGGTGRPHRDDPRPCRDHRPRDLRRSGLQVPDLGAGALRGLSRRGAEPAPRPAPAAGSGAPGGSRRMTRALPTAAADPVPHVPVLLDAVMDYLAPSAGGLYIDGTFGAGGYSRALLAAGASVIGIDRDPTA